MATHNPRINENIRANRVRVVAPDGEQVGIMSIDEALEKADDYELDLVEIAPQADPPVCRVMDYGKYKYQQSKRAAEARKRSSRVELKEVKLRPKTDRHDLDTKIGRARQFLEKNNKVKFTVMFRGREITHPEIAQVLLEDAIEKLEDVARVEQAPRMEGRNMIMLLSPR